MTSRECEAVASFLQGLTNPLRLKILYCLRSGEKNVTEITACTGERQPNVSHQLKVLVTKGYVSRRKERRKVYYSLNSEKIVELLDQVREIILSESGETRGAKTMQADKVLDALGLMCPMPIQKLAKVIKEIQIGQVIEVRVDDTLTASDLPIWCEKTGQELLGTCKHEDYTSYFVRRRR